MERTKLVSVRLETETFEKIEKIVARETYYKRSDVINNLLKAVLDNFDNGQIHNMMYRWKWDRNVVNTQFEVTKELKPYERK
jgi:metal-responsive CopG/Arc/MetJ family transcriptional regulator